MMFSKEEAKQRREQFWTMFGKRYQRKWILYDTKIKDIALAFSFEDNRAMVSLDLVHNESFFRSYYWEKIQSLQTILLDTVDNELIFDPGYVLSSGKEISRVYIFLEGVKIQKQTDWPIVYDFFFKYMDLFEQFFWEYKDLLEE